MFSQKYEPSNSYQQYSKNDVHSESEDDCEDVDEMMVVSTSKKQKENNPHFQNDQSSPIRQLTFKETTNSKA